MTLQNRINAAQGNEAFKGEKALARQSGVESRGGVSLGEDEAIAILPLGVGRVYLHFSEIQVGHDVGDGKRSAGMSRGGGVGTVQNAQTDHGGLLLQLCQLCGIHSRFSLLARGGR